MPIAVIEFDRFGLRGDIPSSPATPVLATQARSTQQDVLVPMRGESGRYVMSVSPERLQPAPLPITARGTVQMPVYDRVPPPPPGVEPRPAPAPTPAPAPSPTPAPAPAPAQPQPGPAFPFPQGPPGFPGPPGMPTRAEAPEPEVSAPSGSSWSWLWLVLLTAGIWQATGNKKSAMGNIASSNPLIAAAARHALAARSLARTAPRAARKHIDQAWDSLEQSVGRRGIDRADARDFQSTSRLIMQVQSSLAA